MAKETVERVSKAEREAEELEREAARRAAHIIEEAQVQAQDILRQADAAAKETISREQEHMAQKAEEIRLESLNRAETEKEALRRKTAEKQQQAVQMLLQEFIR